jgi:metal-dependent amidase/aminoacylase/carboxypeptidase family protein
VVKGQSAHAAKPNEGVDAIAVGATIVGELQKLVSRETDAFDPLVVSVTSFAAGGADNVVADRAELKGTIRSGRPETRRRVLQRLEALASGLAASHGARATSAIVASEPAVDNDAGMMQLIRSVAPDAFLPLPGWTAADDFGFYSRGHRRSISGSASATRRREASIRRITRSSGSTRRPSVSAR